MNNSNKVVLLPCNGIGQAISTIIREACFRVKAEEPELVILGNSAALAAGLQEEVNLLRDHRVILIDGCIERCGRYLLDEFSLKTAETVFAPEILAKHRLSMNNVSRVKLNANGEKIAEILKAEILNRVTEIQRSLP